MGAPKSAVTKAVDKVVARAEALDLRRRTQLDNQRASIDRLLQNQGRGYDAEMATLHELLAEAQAELAEIKEKNHGTTE